MLFCWSVSLSVCFIARGFNLLFHSTSLNSPAACVMKKFFCSLINRTIIFLNFYVSECCFALSSTRKCFPQGQLNKSVLVCYHKISFRYNEMSLRSLLRVKTFGLWREGETVAVWRNSFAWKAFQGQRLSLFSFDLCWWNLHPLDMIIWIKTISWNLVDSSIYEFFINAKWHSELFG